MYIYVYIYTLHCSDNFSWNFSMTNFPRHAPHQNPQLPHEVELLGCPPGAMIFHRCAKVTCVDLVYMYVYICICICICIYSYM